MDGVALCARFSIATNRLRYCGPEDAEPALYAAITSGRGSPAARAALARFEALMPYLEAIGSATGRDPFDPEVVAAYWLGNELLEAVDRPGFLRLLEALRGRGLPASIARRLAEHLPERPLPHHVFHVAYVGVGAVTGHVPTTLSNLEACRPAAAEVRAVGADALTVAGPTLAPGPSGLVLRGHAERTVAYDPRVLEGVGVGRAVVLHWSWPALLPDPRSAARLEQWTQRSLDAANQALPALGVVSFDPPASGRT